MSNVLERLGARMPYGVDRTSMANRRTGALAATALGGSMFLVAMIGTTEHSYSTACTTTKVAGSIWESGQTAADDLRGEGIHIRDVRIVVDSLKTDAPGQEVCATEERFNGPLAFPVKAYQLIFEEPQIQIHPTGN